MTHRTRRVVVTQRFFDEAAIAYLQAEGCEVAIADLPSATPESRGSCSRPFRSWPSSRGAAWDTSASTSKRRRSSAAW